MYGHVEAIGIADNNEIHMHDTWEVATVSFLYRQEPTVTNELRKKMHHMRRKKVYDQLATYIANIIYLQ